VNVVQRLVGLQVSDLNNEWVWTVRLAAEDELSHNDCVVCSATEGTDPPLGSGKMWGVNGECLVIWVPCSGSFQSSNVGTVTELSLSITSNVLVCFSLLEELLVLFW